MNQERYERLQGDLPGEALEKYEDELTPFERQELTK
jgi:hypothetical protein